MQINHSFFGEPRHVPLDTHLFTFTFTHTHTGMNTPTHTVGEDSQSVLILKFYVFIKVCLLVAALQFDCCLIAAL